MIIVQLPIQTQLKNKRRMINFISNKRHQNNKLNNHEARYNHTAHNIIPDHVIDGFGNRMRRTKRCPGKKKSDDPQKR